MPSCDEYVDAYLADYSRRNRSNSLQTQTCRLRRFREDFKGRSLEISRSELKQWVHGEGPWSKRGPIPRWEGMAITSLYNHAIDEDDLPLERSPARKLRPRPKDRADQSPPLPQEFEALVAACSALGDYDKMMRAALLFAAYTLVRPSELFALEWTDIDFGRMRVRNRDTVEDLKACARLIALTPTARDLIKRLPQDSKRVFTSKSGRPLTAPTFAGYWNLVLAAAGLRFGFHHATKHYGVHYMWTELGLSARAIAAQAGWTLHNANRILAAYGHGEVGALEEVDAAFSRPVGFPSRGVGKLLDLGRR
jgi:integrase